jgi:hypothetical protein
MGRVGFTLNSSPLTCFAHQDCQAPEASDTCNSEPFTVISAARGAVAQLGERSVRNAEVVGSIPIGSTRDFEFAALPGGSSRLQIRTWGSHLRLLVAFDLADSGAGVPPRCAGVPTPTTHPLRTPLARTTAAPFGVINPHRLHQASFSTPGWERSLPRRSRRRSRAYPFTSVAS